MALSLPFGNYVAEDTPVHRLDARIKLLLMAVFVFTLFACRTWAGLLVSEVLIMALFIAARIPGRLIFRGLMPIMVILLFTFFANALTFSAVDPAVAAAAINESSASMAAAANTANEEYHLLALPWLGLDLDPGWPESIPLIGSFGIRPLGVVKGLYFVVRICLLVLLTSLLTYTSSVVSLTDAVVSILSPLRALRVPTEDIAMVFTIALRFIPLTALEAERLVVAQSARGARFNEGGLIKRVRAYVPVMIPLFVNLFRRADHLALAMEGRCYVGRGRTRLTHTHLTLSDGICAVLGSFVLVATGLLL